ncbi:hypothetical protein [Bradyrhizobium roseum]|nr:hypothetical protein [Bradyrhizobium roseus]WKA26542.1 hypothetical protein QUH67_23495 [Bradyrhizobium roseus]
MSPSGEDITAARLESLAIHLEGVDEALKEIDQTPRAAAGDG